MPAGIRAAADLVRTGDLTPTDLAEMSIARVRQTDPVLQAFVHLDEQQVREDAAILSREAATGRFRGPLHGIPVAVKDVIDVAGAPTRAGSDVTDPAPALADATAVARLRAAGALILGKTRTHEFAQGVITPPSRNPWNTDCIPGGSSGGSAVAVASGQCLAALGTDTGGSIRVPAALCGVSGLRPARGDIPTDGVLAFSPRLDTCGPIARDALDLALMFGVLSGRFRPAAVHAGIRGLRIGTVDRAALGDVSDEVDTAVAAAVSVLAEAGADLRPVEVPAFPSWSAPRAVYVLTDFLEVQRRTGFFPRHRGRYGDEVASHLRQAEQITPEARSVAAAELHRLGSALQSGLADVDVVVLPTTVICAPRVADCEFDPRAHGRASVIGTLMRLCGPFSWCGLAAVTVPCGFTASGLPIGVQIAGRDASTVLAAAAAYQAQSGQPPVPLG